MPVAFSSKEQVSAKVVHQILLGRCLDNTNEPKPNALETKCCLYRSKVAVGNNNTSSIRPRFDKVIQDITPMEKPRKSVVERQ